MKIKKILIYGSTVLTREACDLLKDHYDLVGHIPSENPHLLGKINLPIVDDTIDHDIKLSLQYNKKFYRDGSLVPEKSLLFTIRFIPFAEIKPAAASLN